MGNTGSSACVNLSEKSVHVTQEGGVVAAYDQFENLDSMQIVYAKEVTTKPLPDDVITSEITQLFPRLKSIAKLECRVKLADLKRFYGAASCYRVDGLSFDPLDEGEETQFIEFLENNANTCKTLQLRQMPSERVWDFLKTRDFERIEFILEKKEEMKVLIEKVMKDGPPSKDSKVELIFRSDDKEDKSPKAFFCKLLGKKAPLPPDSGRMQDGKMTMKMKL